MSSSWTENKLLLSSIDIKDNIGVTALACVERSIPQHIRSNKGVSFLFENKKTKFKKIYRKNEETSDLD